MKILPSDCPSNLKFIKNCWSQSRIQKLIGNGTSHLFHAIYKSFANLTFEECSLLQTPSPPPIMSRMSQIHFKQSEAAPKASWMQVIRSTSEFWNNVHSIRYNNFQLNLTVHEYYYLLDNLLQPLQYLQHNLNSHLAYFQSIKNR